MMVKIAKKLVVEQVVKCPVFMRRLAAGYVQQAVEIAAP